MRWLQMFQKETHQTTQGLAILISLTSLSLFGVSVFSSDTWGHTQGQHVLQEEEEKEMSRWSSSLQDKNHPNFNPYLMLRK